MDVIKELRLLYMTLDYVFMVTLSLTKPILLLFSDTVSQLYAASNRSFDSID